MKSIACLGAWLLIACSGATGPDGSLDGANDARPDATVDSSAWMDSGSFDAPPPTCTVDASQGATSDAGVNVVQLALGDRHSCGLLDDGTVRCWGGNSAGQLGDGTLLDRVQPTPVVMLDHVVQLAAGGDHTCAVTTDRRVYCWGANDSGQIGDGSRLARSTPTRATLASGSDVVADEVEAGFRHTCARGHDGSVYCWGANQQGQLADGSTTMRLQSTGALTSATAAVGVSAGNVDTCAVIQGGTALCWGNDDEGQLGDCQFSNPQTAAVPVRVPTDTGTATPVTGVMEITVGWVHACARMIDGTVMCWGNGVDGQLGYVVPVTGGCHEPMGFGNQFPAAKRVPGVQNARQVVASGTSTCAVLADGTLWCWGANLSGQIALCTTSQVRMPTQVPIVGNVAEVRLGESHGCARLFTGDVLCWGDNEDGRLGDGTRISRRAPGFVQF